MKRTLTAHRKALQLGCILLAVTVLINVNAADDDLAAAEFLDTLAGRWKGRALRTPRGPLPYDIDFTRDVDGSVSGIANPGAALHHWTFFIQENRVRLRFLTSFGGNTEPVRLTSVGASPGGAWIFKAEDPPYLEVQVKPHSDNIDIFIKLRGKPHVDIRLTSRKDL